MKQNPSGEAERCSGRLNGTLEACTGPLCAGCLRVINKPVKPVHAAYEKKIVTTVRLAGQTLRSWCLLQTLEMRFLDTRFRDCR